MATIHTQVFALTKQACETLQRQIFDQGADCDAVARKVDGAAEGIKAAAWSGYETASAIPTGIVNIYRDIGEVFPFGLGRVLQVVVLAAAALAVYDRWRGPRVHVYYPEKNTVILSGGKK